MWNLIKKYIDIFGGIILSIILTIIARFKLEKIQLMYSMIILMLVCIGICSVVKKTANNRIKNPKKERKKNIIDKLVEGRKEIKAVNIAQNPLKEGEELYVAIKKGRKDIKKIMSKIKKFFDKFKGVILSILLVVISLISEYGGFVEEIFGGKLVIKGVNIISLVALISAVIVGLLSDTHTSEQIKKIKELFTQKPSNEIVNEELKNQLKLNETKRKNLEKQIESENSTLDGLTKDLEQATNVYNAKIEMLNMTPKLAAEEDVQNAQEKVNEINYKIEAEKNVIIELEKNLYDVNTMITMLKTRLDQN